MILVDTSVVLDSPEVLLEEDTYLVRETLDELDRLKCHSGTKGYLARHAIKFIYDIKFNRYAPTPSNVKGETVDKVFISLVKNKANQIDISNIRLKDYNLANYLRSEGIEVDVIEPRREMPEAYFFDTLPDEQIQEILNNNVTRIKDTRPNRYGIINPEQGSILAYSRDGRARKVRERTVHISNSACINARNKEQIFLIDGLLNTDIPLIIVSGPAGTGKTLISIACGLYGVLKGFYKKLLILTPPVHVGNKDKLGFFPGNKDEKLRNYFGGARDALEYILGDNWDREYGDFIDFESTTLTRGRSYRDAFIFLDEAQNTTPAEMLTLVTRVGEGSKLIVAGDLEQSDISRSADRTGLGAVVNALYDSKEAVYLEMYKPLRSNLVVEATRKFREVDI
ncbi:MAG: PhoH family protein [Clostridia bacterium]